MLDILRGTFVRMLQNGDLRKGSFEKKRRSDNRRYAARYQGGLARCFDPALCFRNAVYTDGLITLIKGRKKHGRRKEYCKEL